MTMWRGAQPLILASQSAARQMLLRSAGIAFEAIPADLDERAIQTRAALSSPQGVAALLAHEKACHVAARHPGRMVIGADQTASLGGRIFSKPQDRAQAQMQLRGLAGHTHVLHSAVTIMRDKEVLFADVAQARMTMRPLSEAALTAYLDAADDAVLTSVGAYQIESLGIHLFAGIEGDHATILGLPLLPLLAYLRDEKLLAIA